MSLFFVRPCILGKDISYIKFRRKFEILQPLFHRIVPNEKYFNLTEAIDHVGYFETTTMAEMQPAAAFSKWHTLAKLWLFKH